MNSVPAKRLFLLLSIALFAGAAHGRMIGGAGSHRLPRPPAREAKVPESGFRLNYVDELQAIADHVTKRTVRLEAHRAPRSPLEASSTRMEDGAGVLVAQGRLLTTARYLEGALEVRVIRRDGRPIEGKVERLDVEAGLATVTFDRDEAPGLEVVSGFAPLPEPHEEGAASEVVVPVQLVGSSTSVRVAAIMEGEDAIFISGQLANGVPAFDRFGRLVALADRPTPDRSRTVALAAENARDWLDDRSSDTAD